MLLLQKKLALQIKLGSQQGQLNLSFLLFSMKKKHHQQELGVFYCHLIQESVEETNMATQIM